MKESYQPFPTVAKNGRLPELSCLNKRPVLETPLLTPNTNPTCDIHESYKLVSQIIVSFTWYLYRFMSHPQSLKAHMKVA
jgi:hypothetical protein